MLIKKIRKVLLFFTLVVLLLSLYIFRENILFQLLTKIDLSHLDVQTARTLATPILDAASIPDGDLSLTSHTAHSKRYIISKWQRAAVGASVIVFGRHPDGTLSVILGPQRGMLRNPQGYMEIPLPKEDLTGLKASHSSRLNGKKLKKVKEDLSLEDNAVREVFEEAGLTIKKEDLVLLRINSEINANPICFAAQYMVILNDTPKLSNHASEFVNDDLQKPTWVKLSDIHYNARDKHYFVKDYPMPIDPKTIDSMNLGLLKMGLNPLAQNSSERG